MEPVVLSLGGSVLITDGDDVAYIRDLSKMLVEVSESRKVMVVTGGGRIARHYIRSARELGASEDVLDEMGIAVTRLNARLLALALGDRASQTIPEDYDEAVSAAGSHSVVVMGGVAPGITTDAVSATLAERAGARLLVNATSVDGAYTSDPRKDSAAKRIPEMSHEALVKLVAGTPAGAGPNVVFDPTGARVAERSNITLAIVDGRRLENLRSALLGQDFDGTTVH
ncbi:MAG: UMP kinase [Methanobacteriota archaeon]|nr:MAG: UMP kinase [Euryarchaeota archaeon]